MGQSIIETLLSKVCFVKQHCQRGQFPKYYVLTLQETAAYVAGLLEQYLDHEAYYPKFINCVGVIDGVYLMTALHKDDNYV